MGIYNTWSREDLIAELQRRDAAAYWAQGQNLRGAGRKPVLTPELRETVHARRKQGATFRLIAEETGLSLGLVHKAAQA